MISVILTSCEHCSKKWFQISSQCQGLIFASVLAWKESSQQPTNLTMQWRVVAIFAAMIAAVVCGPIAGPSVLSRALGSVLEEETTMGIIVDLLNFCYKLKFVFVPANISFHGILKCFLSYFNNLSYISPIRHVP